MQEVLRNEIISIVKQSAALNRAGAENMKPRQLSNAIHDDIRLASNFFQFYFGRGKYYTLGLYKY